MTSPTNTKEEQMPDPEAEQMPMLAGHQREDGLGLKVWCRWCDAWHVHGHGSGHRVAHCGPDTPYSETGYLIVEETHYDDIATALPPVGDADHDGLLVVDWGAT